VTKAIEGTNNSMTLIFLSGHLTLANHDSNSWGETAQCAGLLAAE